MVAFKNKNKVLCSTPEHRIESPSRDSDSLYDSDAASPVPFLCTQDGTEGETDVVWNHYTPKSDTTKTRSKNTTPLSRRSKNRHNSMPESPSIDNFNKPSTSGMVFGRYNSMPINKDDQKEPGDSPIRCTPEEIKKKHQLAREKLLAKRQLPFTTSQSTNLSSQLSQPAVETKKPKFQPKVASDRAFNVQKSNVTQSKYDKFLEKSKAGINGGNVTAGLGIYDTMQYITPPVATWCVGQACSMASLLLAAGAPGMRHALPNSRIMIHQPSGGVRGQATDIQIQAEEILKLKAQINMLYVRHTGLPLEKVQSSMERDCFMSPTEAKTFGIIDNVLEHPPSHAMENEAVPASGSSTTTPN
ncbi:unnamed protein product, partial [Iphiclides podalirius]